MGHAVLCDGNCQFCGSVGQTTKVVESSVIIQAKRSKLFRVPDAF